MNLLTITYLLIRSVSVFFYQNFFQILFCFVMFIMLCFFSFLFCDLFSFTIDTNRGRFMELFDISIYNLWLYIEYNQFSKNVY